MRNELIDLYKLACANPKDKDVVRAYQRARDRIGPQIAIHEALDNDNFRARFANWQDDINAVLKHRDDLHARVVKLEDAAIHIYNSGYHAGHHYTVEGGYVDIHPSDMDTYHAEEVAELLAALVGEG